MNISIPPTGAVVTYLYVYVRVVDGRGIYGQRHELGVLVQRVLDGELLICRWSFFTFSFVVAFRGSVIVIIRTSAATAASRAMKNGRAGGRGVVGA